LKQIPTIKTNSVFIVGICFSDLTLLIGLQKLTTYEHAYDTITTMLIQWTFSKNKRGQPVPECHHCGIC